MLVAIKLSRMVKVQADLKNLEILEKRLVFLVLRDIQGKLEKENGKK